MHLHTPHTHAHTQHTRGTRPFWPVAAGTTPSLSPPMTPHAGRERKAAQPLAKRSPLSTLSPHPTGQAHVHEIASRQRIALAQPTAAAPLPRSPATTITPPRHDSFDVDAPWPCTVLADTLASPPLAPAGVTFRRTPYVHRRRRASKHRRGPPLHHFSSCLP